MKIIKTKEKAEVEITQLELRVMFESGNPKIKAMANEIFELLVSDKYPINGDTTNAMTPIQKSVFHQQVNLILNILDTLDKKNK